MPRPRVIPSFFAALIFCTQASMSLLLHRAEAQTFEIRLLDESTLQGSKIGIDGENCSFVVGGKEGRVSIKQIRSIKRKPAAISNPSMLVGLLDGSQIAIANMTGKNDEWDLEDASGKWKLGTQQVKWLRMRTPSPAEAPNWETCLSENSDLDQLIIARGEGVLDQAAGEMISIDHEFAHFRFDKDDIDAPRNKLLGIIWYRKGSSRMQPSIQIKLASGTTWIASQVKVELSEQPKVDLKSLGGIERTVGFDQWVEIDFSSLNLKWLHESPLLGSKAESNFRIDQQSPERAKLFSARFVSRDGSTAPSDQDLLFPGPGEITFRIPEGFRRFDATVERYASGDSRSDLVLEAWQNDLKMWDGLLKPSDKQIQCSMEIKADQRLKLVVRSKSTLNAGSEVRWIQPRFSR